MTDRKPPLNPDDIDCYGTDDIVCPWCGAHMEATDFCLDGRAEDYDCDDCDRTFYVEPDYSVTYTTTRKESAS